MAIIASALAGEMFKRRAGIDIQAVPYKSSPEGVTDVVAGRVSMMFSDMTPVLPLTRSGQLRALATITKDRSALFAELPSVQERGLRQRLAEIGFEAQWIAPKEFAERLAADIELWATLTKEAGIERQ